ncbi:MAG: hypothetical protein PUE01_10910 [Clostridiaceae bacterium]|nr:hypothetical protein [Clostridiaceae bacterium]
MSKKNKKSPGNKNSFYSESQKEGKKSLLTAIIAITFIVGSTGVLTRCESSMDDDEYDEDDNTYSTHHSGGGGFWHSYRDSSSSDSKSSIKSSSGGKSSGYSGVKGGSTSS